MIARDEHLLVGRWIFDGRSLFEDETASRIQRLVRTYLEKLGHDKSGWDRLYRDPIDGRIWELTYPDGHMHGGGPPKLECVSLDTVKAKYAI